MNTTFDTIIWGPSLEGIKKAVELKKQGQRVLLAGKFGFPGGKATESLSVLFREDYFEDNGVLNQLHRIIQSLKFGVLYQNKPWILFHPEAVKRACWQILNESNIDLLFHVTPLPKTEGLDNNFSFFGREGEINLQAGKILDFSDDKLLSQPQDQDSERIILINSFFAQQLPHKLPGFELKRTIETPTGQYVSMQVKNVKLSETEQVFNRELDRLINETWKKYHSRISVIPVYPEIIHERCQAE